MRTHRDVERHELGGVLRPVVPVADRSTERDQLADHRPGDAGPERGPDAHGDPGPGPVPTPTVTPTPPAPDATPPPTSLRRARINHTKAKATFTFASGKPGSTFSCKLDSRKRRPCTSPKTYKKLEPGKHVFRVRARDRAGNRDATPAVKRFKIAMPDAAG